MTRRPIRSTLFPYTTLFRSDKAFYATSGAGTLPHFLGLLLAREAGVTLTHVPYKGAAAYQGELVSGMIPAAFDRSEEHTSELQSRRDLVCRLLLEKK